MTFTYKLSRRLARLRKASALLVPILTACAAGEPTSPTDVSIDTGTEGPVALSPRAVTLEGTQGVLFRAFESLIPGSSQVTSIEWTASGGSIDASGSYSSVGTGEFRVIGRRKGNPHNPPDTSIVVVVPSQPTLVAVELTPTSATVGGGLQQQFSAIGRLSDGSEVAIGVTWSATGGTIDAGGLFTAPRTAGTYKVIAQHVTTGIADTATVSVPPATLTSITLSPGSVSLSPGQGQPFSVVGRLSDGTTTSSVPVAYSATGGSISVTGYYSAGSAGGTFRVIATSQGGMADTSAVTITASAPVTSSLLYNADFESGSWPSGTGLISCAPGRILIYDNATKPAGAPTSLRGTHAVKFTTRNTDLGCGGTTPDRVRSQAEPPLVLENGGEYWASESMYFPLNTPVTQGEFWQFSEFYSPVAGGNPPVGMYVGQGSYLGKLQIKGGYDAATLGTRTIALLDRPLGHWLTTMFHIKVSTDPTVGFIELWYSIDGQPMQAVPLRWLSGTGVGTFSGNRLYCQTMKDTWMTGGMTLITNNYRSPDLTLSGGATETVIYFDEIKMGTTRQSVELPTTTATLAVH